MRELLAALAIMAACHGGAQNITGYEYWVDQGGDDRTLVATPVVPTLSLLADLDVADIAPGQHTIHYRLRDSNARWSSVISKPFTRLVGGPNELVGGEYWFDTLDGARTTFSLTPGQVVSTTLDPDASGLAQGSHTAHYRLVDNHGRWSSVLSKPFNLNPGEPFQLVLLRYWSEQATLDPSDLTEVPITPAVQYLDIIDDVLFCNWSAEGTTDVYFQLKDNHGQWSSVITESYTVDVVAAPPAEPLPTAGPSNPPFNSTQTYATTLAPDAGAYIWILPSGWTGNSSGPSITVEVGDLNPGWNLGVVAVNGCGTSDTTWLDITTGMGTAPVNTDVQLFPNPTTGRVQLETKGQGTVQLRVINSTGNLVRELHYANNARHTIDLSDMAVGVYTIHLVQRGSSHVVKLVIEH